MQDFEVCRKGGERLFLRPYSRYICSNILESTNSRVLVKRWISVQGGEERSSITERYQTFCELQLCCEAGLRCLPQEYVEVQGDPAYVMERAKGLDMSEAWSEIKRLKLDRRLRIARSIAEAISVLHSHSVAHADIKLENLVWDQDSDTVQLLDVDGGGYWGKKPNTKPLRPSVWPLDIYIAPELSQFGWASIWADAERRKLPDLWSLAVLIHCIVTGQPPFRRDYYEVGSEQGDSEWPCDQQLKEYRNLGIDSCLIEGFNWVFSAKNRTCFEQPIRILASEWAERLTRSLNGNKKATVRTEIGRVKFFLPSKNYGFIKRPYDSDVFFHSSIMSNSKLLKEGMLVEFTAENRPKGLQAISVRPLE